MARHENEKVRAIREKARIERALDDRRRKRRRLITQFSVAGGLVIVIAAIAGGVYLLGQSRAASAAGPVADATAPLSTGDQVRVASEAHGVSVGAADAPVTMDVYEDYSCPHCAQFEAQSGPLLDRIAATGQVRVVYHPIQIVSKYGQVAGSAAACVLAEEPDRWPAVHSALFDNHSTVTDSWTHADFVTWLTTEGVSSDAARTCVAEGRYSSWITDNTSDATAAGVTGTPTLRIQGDIVKTVAGQDLVDALTKAGAQLPADIAADS
jgi:protein-disulfide isomerase